MPTELQELQLRVSLINEASEGVSRIRDELKELASGTGKTAMDKLKEEQSELAKQIKELGELAEGGGRSLVRYIGKFGVAGAAMGGLAASILVGLSSLKEFADRVVDLTNKAKVIGMNPAELKSLIEQYDRLGVSAGVVEQSMAGLSNVLAQVNRIGSEKRLEMIKAAGQFGTLMEQGIQRVEAQATQAGKLQEVIRQSYVVYDERMKATEGNQADAIKSQNDFLRLWEMDPVLKVLRHVEQVSEEEKKRFEARAKATADYKKVVSDLHHEVDELGADLSTSMLGAGGTIVTGLHLMLDLVKELRELWKQPWVPTNVKSGALTTVDLLKHAATGIGDQGGATFKERWPGAPVKPANEQPAGLMSAPAPGSPVSDQIPGIGKGWEWMRRSENIEDRREVDESMRQGDDYLKNIEKNTAETKRLNENFKLLDQGDVELKGLGGLPGFGKGAGGGFGGGGATGTYGGGGDGGGGGGGGAPNGSSVGPGTGKGSGESHPATGKGGGSVGPSDVLPDLGGSGKTATGADPDQIGHPRYLSGGVSLAGEQFHWGSGGPRGAGAIPYGKYPINIGKGDIGPIGQRIGSVATVGGLGGEFTGGGHHWTGVQIHTAFSDRLDQLYTLGCFSIARSEWPRFKQKLLEENAKHPEGLELEIGRNGMASITPKGSTVELVPTHARDPDKKAVGGLTGNVESDWALASQGKLDTAALVASARKLGGQQDDRSAIDGASQKSVRTVKIDINGKLTADVNAPKGADVKVNGEGAFTKTETNRTMPIEAD
jgi:hypothetical protein